MNYIGIFNLLPSKKKKKLTNVTGLCIKMEIYLCMTAAMYDVQSEGLNLEIFKRRSLGKKLN